MLKDMADSKRIDDRIQGDISVSRLRNWKEMLIIRPSCIHSLFPGCSGQTLNRPNCILGLN